MGCGCKGNKEVKTVVVEKATEKETTQTFSLLRTDGSTDVFGSRLEADAARVRAGGGHIRSQ